MKIETVQMIQDSDWDKCVQDTYKRPYCFQQQDGCRNRGLFYFKVPTKNFDYTKDTLPETTNTVVMGVSFKAWLERDPKLPFETQRYPGELDLWWSRNFYPEFQTVANDLHKRGILKAGEYLINIDW